MMIVSIYEHLENNGLNPCMVGQHKGDCEDPFIILREGTQIPSINSRMVGMQIIDIIIYIPINDYSALKVFREKVITAIREFDFLRKTGTETPPIVDESKLAYTMSIEYVLQKKLEG